MQFLAMMLLGKGGREGEGPGSSKGGINKEIVLKKE
jgi:hypothetical protein